MYDAEVSAGTLVTITETDGTIFTIDRRGRPSA
ncbi:unnamed protein product, partial [marine sediment metagenome]